MVSEVKLIFGIRDEEETPEKADLASYRMDSKSESLKRINGCIRVALRNKGIDSNFRDSWTRGKI